MQDNNIAERRITLRLISYWEKLRQQKTMPSESDINPEDLQDLWDYCFLIHVKDMDKPDYNYTYFGKEIQKAYLGELSMSQSNMLISPNAINFTAGYQRVIESKLPVIEEGEFTNLLNDVIKYRQCMLPLGENGKVDAIFGGMRFKIFSQNS